MTAAREIPIHHCATCGDPIRSRRHAIVEDGAVYCCLPCYRYRPITTVVTR